MEYGRRGATDRFELQVVAPRHVWVDVTGGRAEPAPGLLLAWRRTAGARPAWEANCVIVTWVPAHQGQTLTQGWFAAEHVRPA